MKLKRNILLKKISPIIVSLLLLCVLIFVYIYTKKSEKLLFNLESYQSFEVVKYKLKLPDSIRNPSTELTLVEIENEEHLGIKGTIGLGFLDNRLVSTAFMPDDSLRYMKNFKKKYGCDL